MGIDWHKFNSGTPQVLRSELAKNTLILLFIGRLVEKKGVNDLLTAYSMLTNEQRNQTQLWIIGNGTERKPLENLSRSLNIDNKITFLGKLPNDQLPDYYAAADIFIAPSISDSTGDTEGQGVTLVEAMASATAIISTDTGGISEVIEHNQTGILVPPQNPAKLKSAIAELITNKKLRGDLASKGNQSAENYAWSLVAQKFQTLYEQISTKR